MQHDDDLIREHFNTEYEPESGDQLLVLVVVGGLCAVVGYIIGTAV